MRASKRATTHTGTGWCRDRATIAQHLAKVGVCYSTILELNPTPIKPRLAQAISRCGTGCVWLWFFFLGPGAPSKSSSLHSKSGDFTRARRRISGV